MVRTPVLEQAVSGKKRDSDDIDEDSSKDPSTNPCSDMKKPRIAAGEEIIEGDRDYPPSPTASQSPGKGNIEEIKGRINKYLEVRPSPSRAPSLISDNSRKTKA